MSGRKFTGIVNANTLTELHQVPSGHLGAYQIAAQMADNGSSTNFKVNMFVDASDVSTKYSIDSTKNTTSSLSAITSVAGIPASVINNKPAGYHLINLGNGNWVYRSADKKTISNGTTSITNLAVDYGIWFIVECEYNNGWYADYDHIMMSSDSTVGIIYVFHHPTFSYFKAPNNSHSWYSNAGNDIKADFSYTLSSEGISGVFNYLKNSSNLNPFNTAGSQVGLGTGAAVTLFSGADIAGSFYNTSNGVYYTYTLQPGSKTGRVVYAFDAFTFLDGDMAMIGDFTNITGNRRNSPVSRGMYFVYGTDTTVIEYCGSSGTVATTPTSIPTTGLPAGGIASMSYNPTMGFIAIMNDDSIYIAKTTNVNNITSWVLQSATAPVHRLTAVTLNSSTTVNATSVTALLTNVGADTNTTYRNISITITLQDPNGFANGTVTNYNNLTVTDSVYQTLLAGINTLVFNDINNYTYYTDPGLIVNNGTIEFVESFSSTSKLEISKKLFSPLDKIKIYSDNKIRVSMTGIEEPI